VAKKKPDFIKDKVVKDYIAGTAKMRAGASAVKKLMADFESAIAATIKAAAGQARAGRRSTILRRDVVAALEAQLGKKHLEWREIVREVLRQTPADLGKISKAINNNIDKAGR